MRRPNEDRRSLDADQQRLVADHWPDALKVAGWFSRQYPRLDVDWGGVVGLELCWAALDYETGHGISFWTYAERRAEWACRNEMRYARRRGFRFFGKKRVDDEAVWSAYAADGPAKGRPVGWEADMADELERLTRDLPRRHRRMIEGQFVESIPVAVLSREMGIGKRQAYYIRDEALQMLREAM